MAEIILEIQLTKCQICSDSHVFKFEVRTLPLFGGNVQSIDEIDEQLYEVVLVCPKKNQHFKAEIAVPRPKGKKIVKVKQITHE